MPIDRQILLILLQMRCYDNGVSLDKIVTIIGIGHSTVNCVCHCIITAIQRSNLRIEYVRWLKREVKEVAKQWVENQVDLPT